MPERELLRDLPLHQGITTDENQCGKAHGRQGGRGQCGAKLPGSRPGEYPGQAQRGGRQDGFGARQVTRTAREAGGQGRAPVAAPDRHGAPPKRKENQEEAETVAQGIVTHFSRDRQQCVDGDGQAGNPLVEERARQAKQGKEDCQRGQGRHRLGGDPPCIRAGSREHADHRLERRDQCGVKRVLVRLANDIRPGIMLELAGDADEFQAVLGGQQRPTDRDRVQDRREQDDREQISASSHPDPP